MTASTNPAALGAQIAVGRVRHSRLRPAVHRFDYPTCFLMLPLRRLREQPCAPLRRNRFALLGFHDCDHGDGRDDCLDWMLDLLRREGVHDADGEIWLHCYPRMLGYVFKPVSFWHCHRADGSLAAIVAEVNNTFGERHCYLLAGPGLGYGRELRARKVFHVSPFCRIAGDYRFRFMRTGPGAGPDQPGRPAAAARTVARIEHHDDEGALLLTSVSGDLQPLTAASLRRAFAGMPLMTLGVIARIHWQALKLFTKRVPFFRKPSPPEAFVSR